MDYDSFVQVSHVFAGYTASSGLGRFLGRPKISHVVLRDVTLNLEQGSQVTLFGVSGAGKSTLLRMLTGTLSPIQGTLKINGRKPIEQKDIAAGYISAEETEPDKDTVHESLYAFAATHNIANPEARLSQINEVLDLNSFLTRNASSLATTERLKLNIARAALSDSPLILFDDTADQLGIEEFKEILVKLFSGRTVVIATRFAATAESLALPVLILHKGTMTHYGTCEAIADDVACPRIIDVWIEGLRYDFLRKLRHQKGVAEVRLLPAASFSGQRLRVKLISGNYLPSLYDTVSQAPLIKVEEVPPSLGDIIAKLKY